MINLILVTLLATMISISIGTLINEVIENYKRGIYTK